ncbi:MAG: GntR family transcriptional regulator [Albidovulum sp.]|nr:GntR family transcriptional regulator [Albidovulum sp.]
MLSTRIANSATALEIWTALYIPYTICKYTKMQNAVKEHTRIEPVRKRLVTELIIDRLIPAIASGSLPPGYRLVEDELASELGVSRVPVREAIRELSLQGILCAVPGRGWRISPFDDRQIEEVCSVRIALETAMLTDAMLKYRSDLVHCAELDEALEAIRKSASDSNVEGLRNADVNFHRTAIAVSRNSLGMRIWEGISRQMVIIFGLEIQRGPDFDAVVAQHENLRRFLAEGDPAWLSGVLHEHITGRLCRTPAPPATNEKS